MGGCEFDYSRSGTDKGRLFESRYWANGYHQMRGIFWLSKNWVFKASGSRTKYRTIKLIQDTITQRYLLVPMISHSACYLETLFWEWTQKEPTLEGLTPSIAMTRGCNITFDIWLTFPVREATSRASRMLVIHAELSAQLHFVLSSARTQGQNKT